MGQFGAGITLNNVRELKLSKYLDRADLGPTGFILGNQTHPNEAIFNSF
jgi:hypothetical protein